MLLWVSLSTRFLTDMMIRNKVRGVRPRLLVEASSQEQQAPSLAFDLSKVLRRNVLALTQRLCRPVVVVHYSEEAIVAAAHTRRRSSRRTK
jgi:hypothetical protein